MLKVNRNTPTKAQHIRTCICYSPYERYPVDRYDHQTGIAAENCHGQYKWPGTGHPDLLLAAMGRGRAGYNSIKAQGRNSATKTDAEEELNEKGNKRGGGRGRTSAAPTS